MLCYLYIACLVKWLYSAPSISRPQGTHDRWMYEGCSESKERFAIQRYLLIKERNRICRFYHTPSPTSPHSHLGYWGTCHTMTPVYLFPPCTRWLPGRHGTQRAQILQYCKCSVTISYTTVQDTSGHCSYTLLIVKCQFSRMMRFTFCFNASVMTEGRSDLSASWTSVRLFLNIVHHFHTLAAFITCSP